MAVALERMFTMCHGSFQSPDIELGQHEPAGLDLPLQFFGIHSVFFVYQLTRAVIATAAKWIQKGREKKEDMRTY